MSPSLYTVLQLIAEEEEERSKPVLLVSAVAREVATASGLEVLEVPHEDPGLVYVIWRTTREQSQQVADAIARERSCGYSIGASQSPAIVADIAAQARPRQQAALNRLLVETSAPKPNRAVRRQRRRKRR